MREPLLPMQAYETDVGDGRRWLGHPTQPQGWFSVTHLAYRVAAIPLDDRLPFLATLPESALPDPTRRPTHLDHDGPRTYNPFAIAAEQFRVAAEEMEREGCFEMAYTTVASAARIVVRSDAAGALSASNHLARIARQLGDLATAQEIYESVVEEAGRRGFRSVRGYALAGLGNIATMHGNRPAQHRYFSEALAVAPTGSALEAAARWGLMNHALATESLADALIHGWRAYDLATTDDERAGILSNLASVAFRGRFLEAAISGYENALRMARPTRLWLSIAASAAEAAGAGGRESLLHRLEEEGRRHGGAAAIPFEQGQWLLGLAQGWAATGAEAPAVRFAREARTLALFHEFHELAWRADELLDRVTARAADMVEEEHSIPDVESLPESTRVGLARLRTVTV